MACLSLSYSATKLFFFNRIRVWVVFGATKHVPKVLFWKNDFKIPHIEKNRIFPVFFTLRNQFFPHQKYFSFRTWTVGFLWCLKLMCRIWTRFDLIKIPHTSLELINISLGCLVYKQQENQGLHWPHHHHLPSLRPSIETRFLPQSHFEFVIYCISYVLLLWFSRPVFSNDENANLDIFFLF